MAEIPGVTNPQSEWTAPEATSQVQAESLSRPPASRQRLPAKSKATPIPEKTPQMTARERLQPHFIPLSITANGGRRRTRRQISRRRLFLLFLLALLMQPLLDLLLAPAVAKITTGGSAHCPTLFLLALRLT